MDLHNNPLGIHKPKHRFVDGIQHSDHIGWCHMFLVHLQLRNNVRKDFRRDLEDMCKSGCDSWQSKRRLLLNEIEIVNLTDKIKQKIEAYLHKLQDMDPGICSVYRLYRMNNLCWIDIQDGIVDYCMNLVQHMDHTMQHCFHTHCKCYELHKGLNGTVLTLCLWLVNSGWKHHPYIHCDTNM